MKTNDIKNLDKKYYMNTFGERIPVSFDRGKGIKLYADDGEVYTDFLAGIAVSAVGHNHKTLVKAITKQAKSVLHVSNYYYIEQQAKLAEKICNNSCADKVFFANSGAEANEGAIKLAKIYQYKKGLPEKYEIITLVNSFHGRTVTTLSATGQDVFHNYFFPFTEGFKFVEANDFDAFKNAVTDKTCAVMFECVQGEGGVNILDKDYVKALVEFCNENDITVIIDEVQTGVGRTGKLFAYEHYDIKPDLMTVAKGLGGGLPIGVCMCGEKLAGVMTPSTHGTTFGANPVVCAGANYVLDTVDNEKFLAEVEEKGAYIEKKLRAVNGVKDVRRLGLMIGIELEKGDAHDMAVKCLENGLIIITAKTLMRMLPPLNISYEEIDEALTIFENTIKENI